MAKEEDGIPESVLSEVNKIRREEGGEAEDARIEQDAPAEVEVRLSRRQQKEQERLEQIAAVEARANKAAEVAESLQARMQQQAEQMQRMEALLQQRQAPPEREEKEQEDPDEQYAKRVKKAKAVLAEGDIDGYHDRMARANKDLTASQIRQTLARSAPVQQQQTVQKPMWVQAVESQFSDVVMHPNGLNAVAAFAQIDPATLSPEKLQRAFTRARNELGLAKEPAKDPTRARQMLSGGPTNAQSRGGGGGEQSIKVPANYKQIAKAAGMTPEQYVKAYASMNPREISE